MREFEFNERFDATGRKVIQSVAKGTPARRKVDGQWKGAHYVGKSLGEICGGPSMQEVGTGEPGRSPVQSLAMQRPVEEAGRRV